MIVSHKYRFIFIKTNKTAGTSMEIGLSRFCGNEDIITPISAIDEKTRQEFSGKSPQNYLAPLSEYKLPDYVKLLLRNRKKFKFYNHMPAAEIKEKIGAEIWDNYYKFCFERNPWDRVISQYYYRYKNSPKPGFDDYLQTDFPMILKKRGINLYTINGEITVDKVYLFEELENAMLDIRNVLSLPDEINLPRTKSQYRLDKRHYREILTDVQRKKIEELFAREISLFNFEY